MRIEIGTADERDSDGEAVKFARFLHEKLISNLKITFQNDFVLSLEGDISNNASEGDKLVRAEMHKHTSRGLTRYYTNVVVTT